MSTKMKEQEEAQVNSNNDDTRTQIFTIPNLAKRLGVTSASVRRWITLGQIDPPSRLPVTGERAYSKLDVGKIETWYMTRAADGGTRGPGSAKRREQARRWLAECSGLPVRLTVQSSPAATVTKAVRKWLELDDDLLPVVPLAVAIANQLPGPPVWLVIVAPASSGKSVVIMGLSTVTGVYSISTITPHTFASGMIKRGDSGQAPSLLDRLKLEGYWLLALKDFGTILNLPPLQRNPILAQFREIYDGKYDATFGTGVEVNWSGKLGMLVGATPVIDRYHKLSAELGERFLQFRPTSAAPDDVVEKTLAVADNEEKLQPEIAKAYKSAFYRAQKLRKQLPEKLDTSTQKRAAKLAVFLAVARRPVHHDRYASESQVLPLEGPARLAKAFIRLFHGALVCYAGDEDAAFRLVCRIAVDSIPGRRGQLFPALAQSPNGVTAAQMAERLGCDRGTARRELGDLVLIGLADVEKPSQTDIFRPSDKLRELAIAVFPSSPDQALAKLLDLCTNSTSE